MKRGTLLKVRRGRDCSNGKNYGMDAIYYYTKVNAGALGVYPTNIAVYPDFRYAGV
jgi:hypothetical protein